MTDQSFDKRKLERLLRQRGPMKLAELSEHFPNMTKDALGWAVRKTPNVTHTPKGWDVVRHIASGRYIPEWKPLSYDLYANARLRAGAMDYKAMPSRFV